MLCDTGQRHNHVWQWHMHLSRSLSVAAGRPPRIVQCCTFLLVAPCVALQSRLDFTAPFPSSLRLFAVILQHKGLFSISCFGRNYVGKTLDFQSLHTQPNNAAAFFIALNHLNLFRFCHNHRLCCILLKFYTKKMFLSPLFFLFQIRQKVPFELPSLLEDFVRRAPDIPLRSLLAIASNPTWFVLVCAFCANKPRVKPEAEPLRCWPVCQSLKALRREELHTFVLS